MINEIYNAIYNVKIVHCTCHGRYVGILKWLIGHENELNQVKGIITGLKKNNILLPTGVMSDLKSDGMILKQYENLQAYTILNKLEFKQYKVNLDETSVKSIIYKLEKYKKISNESCKVYVDVLDNKMYNYLIENKSKLKTGDNVHI